MSNIVLNPGESILINGKPALSGGLPGSSVVLGADDHGPVELRAGPTGTITASIGGVAVFACEVVNGTPSTTFYGQVKAMGFVDTTPQAPVIPRP